MKATIIFILFLVQNIVMGQNVEIINNSLINKLCEEKNNIEISQSHQTKIFPLEKRFNNYGQVLIKNNKGIYIIIDGTGRVYKANSKKQDTVLFQRIDSTHFYGYNGAAIIFSNNDTLYSFGGDGYWMKNGHLRFYSEKYNEWDILPLNTEIPVTNILNYFDSTNEEIYYLQIPYKRNSTNQIDGEFALYKLNLKNKTNTRLGELNQFFQDYFPLPTNYIFIKINSLNSILVNFNSSNQYLIDIKNNKSYKLKSTVIQKVFYGNSNDVQISNAYELNNWLYFTRSNDPFMQLDSVKITMDDFIPSDTPFYVPESNNQNLFAGIGLGILILSGAFIYFYRRKKSIQAENTNEEIDIDGFKSIELDLIEKIYKKTAEGKSYSVEDINTALGLSKKSLEIQKKIRTETINRINHRFKLKYNTEEDLIERVRLEEDRRFYKYIINEENGKKALGI
jgi:LPXTG-motif cell wall-anchored protein